MIVLTDISGHSRNKQEKVSSPFTFTCLFFASTARARAVITGKLYSMVFAWKAYLLGRSEDLNIIFNFALAVLRSAHVYTNFIKLSKLENIRYQSNDACVN